MLRRFIMLALLLGLFAVPALSFSNTTVAAPTRANEAVETCRILDDLGTLDELGWTMGECVNATKGAASEHANNFVAATCGLDELEAFFGNKGQCIKAIRELS